MKTAMRQAFENIKVSKGKIPALAHTILRTMEHVDRKAHERKQSRKQRAVRNVW
jgi:hypothetical protein